MAEFLAPEEGPYLETYLKLKGASLTQEQTEKGSFSEVLITYHVSKGVWVPFKDAYKVKGPLNKEGELALDFIDQRRIPLKPGEYQLEVTIDDLKDSTDFLAKVNQTIVIEKKGRMVPDTSETFFAGSSIAGYQEFGQVGAPGIGASGKPNIYKAGYFISDLQLVDEYSKTNNVNILSKAGYDLVPYTSNFYPESKDKVTFYFEVYNTPEYFKLEYDNVLLKWNHIQDGDKLKEKRGTEFLVNIFIQNSDDGRVIEGMRKFFKREPKEVVPVLHSFPIDKLATGNYDIVVEIRDRQNTLLDKRIGFFQRQNSSVENEYLADYLDNGQNQKEFIGSWVTQYKDVDVLQEYLRCLHPISSQDEIKKVNTRMNFRDQEMMQEFMYYFWKKRNPIDPESAWLEYWAEVEKVNSAYSTNFKKGYDTDRGRVYLQYGAPNTISPNYFEPNTYPHEIWHYYVLKDDLGVDQNNRKFVFGNLDMGNDFILIHSDAKNEITNRRWHFDLNKRNNFDTEFDLDQEDLPDHYGSRSKDFFENPY